jgi:molybdopterin converting factor small subunit
MPNDRSALRLRDEAAAPASPLVAVALPPALVRLFPGAVRRLEVPASTVGEMIEALDSRWPGMRDRLCDSRPTIRRHINVFVEGRRATLETRLAPGAEVTVLTAISGG